MSQNNGNMGNKILEQKLMDVVNEHQKVAAVVILYHPDKAFFQNIDSYYSYVDRLYVFDNTESLALKADWTTYPKVVYYHDGVNKGLSERLNSAAAKAIEEGYSWLLTMDQDSRFEKPAIENYFRCFHNFEQKEQVALFGPTPVKSGLQWQPDERWQHAERIITSGALLNLEIFQRIGGFDQALFIDSVDCDYSMRARLAGYFIIKLTGTPMLHELGTWVRRSSIKTLFLVKKEKSFHSPLRCYYMFRNLLYLNRKYSLKDVPELKKIARDVKSRIKRSLLYGRNSRLTFKYLLLAYRDYKDNRMGKFTAMK
jgi:rhamnosyltransferase